MNRTAQNLTLGAEVFLYDGSMNRVYMDQQGNKTNAPQEWGNWIKHLIVEFTSRSAVTNKGTKIPLNRGEDRTMKFTWDKVEQQIKVNKNVRALGDHIATVARDPDIFLEVARITGYKVRE